jgi:GrpB-like predicted nucleotidyltransferase (UPF0157 family)
MVSKGSCKDTIAILAYDRRWPAMYEEEHRRLAMAFGSAAVEIHHIGSTSVPGLSAKPVIDMMIAVRDMNNAQGLRTLMRNLGYVYVAVDDEPNRMFFRKGAPRTHHVHIVRFRGAEYRRHLLFRDHLLSNPSVQAEYVVLKKRLAKEFREDRSSYVEGKSGFIESVLARAKSSGAAKRRRAASQSARK